MISRATGSSVCKPNVMVPSASRDTSRPVRPRRVVGMLIGTISAGLARRFRSRSAARLSTSRDERQAPGKFDHGRLTNFPSGAPRANEPNESNATTRGRKTRSSPRRVEPSLPPFAGEGRGEGVARRRPTISESTRPIGLYPSLHCEWSEAIRGSAAAIVALEAVRPPTPQMFETVSTRPALETRRRTLSWREGWPRSPGRGARGNGNARSPSPQVASFVFGRRPSRN